MEIKQPELKVTVTFKGGFPPLLQKILEGEISSIFDITTTILFVNESAAVIRYTTDDYYATSRGVVVDSSKIKSEAINEIALHTFSVDHPTMVFVGKDSENTVGFLNGRKVQLQK